MIVPLNPAQYQELVRRALEEDIRGEDVTTASTVAPALRARGVLLAKSPCVVAGLAVAFEAFQQLDPGVVATVKAQDGTFCQPGDEIAIISGFAGPMLTAERVALNFLQRLSGIATRTRLFVNAAAGRIIILDTRKTTPLFRALEKYAVRAGGGTNHRSSLSEAVLVKDNHIRLAGGVAAAVERVRRNRPGMPLEIEAQSLEQVDEAIAAGAERILLDNLSLEETRTAVCRIAGRARTEISGGVTLDRIADIASTGADFVSVGSLTHSAGAADISLEIEPV